MNLFIHHSKQAFLSLKKRPGFVFSVVSTMGITLGALLCVVTLAYLLLLKPLPYPNENKLYKVTHQTFNAKNELQSRKFNSPGLRNLYLKQTIFDQAAIAFYGDDISTSLEYQPKITTTYVTPNWFSLLDSQFIHGRGFEKSEDLETYNPVAIISYDTWLNDFSQSADILSKKITFSGTSFKIIGVLTEQFIEPDIYETGRKTEVWLPWDYNIRNHLKDEMYSFPWFVFVGQLKNNTSVLQAQQQITTLVDEHWQQNSVGIDFVKGWYVEMHLQSFRQVILGDTQNTLWLLLAGVLGILVIASGNMTNLFVSRTAQQQQQLAIHAAIGAKKTDLFKMLFAETSLLMGFSTIVALMIAMAGFEIIQHNVAQHIARVNELSLNYVTLLVAVTSAVILSLFFARTSISMVNYHQLNKNLQSGSKNIGVQVSNKLRTILIVSQLAIASALIFVSILLFSNASDAINQDLGFELNNINALHVISNTKEIPSIEQGNATMALIKAELSLHPQISAVSRSLSPLSFSHSRSVSNSLTNENYSPSVQDVDENYFDMINQTIIEGDNFTKADIKNQSDFIIINDVFAKKLAPSGSAIGLHLITSGNETLTVSGVVKSILMPGESSIIPRIYVPNYPYSEMLLIKYQVGKSLCRDQIADLINEIDLNYSVFNYRALEQLKDKRLFREIITVYTTAVLALLTLFLAGIGLYGILSYSTQMRQFEIGTRMAIGAKRGDLIKLIIKDNASAILLGVLLSVGVLSLLTIGFNEQVNHYITLQLLPVFIVTLAMISTLSLFACYLPLRQYINKPVIHALKGSQE
jgi:predicted permease